MICLHSGSGTALGKSPTMYAVAYTRAVYGTVRRYIYIYIGRACTCTRSGHETRPAVQPSSSSLTGGCSGYQVRSTSVSPGSYPACPTTVKSVSNNLPSASTHFPALNVAPTPFFHRKTPTSCQLRSLSTE